MDDFLISYHVTRALKWVSLYEPDWVFENTPIRGEVFRRYADDPVKQGEFLKHLRATKEDMTTFELLTLDAKAWCVAFLKTEGKWKEK